MLRCRVWGLGGQMSDGTWYVYSLCLRALCGLTNDHLNGGGER